MNITTLRPRFAASLEPLAGLFIRTGLSPNQISLLSLCCGVLCAFCYAGRMFIAGSLLLFASAILDLVDGSVARQKNIKSGFGAVFDWIVDKYVDAIVILAIGFSGIPIVSQIFNVPPIFDFGIAGIAVTGSMMNTFIKPVVYAEIGYTERIGGKIEDPLEGVGFFGRPETVLALGIGGILGYIWVAVLLIAVCTNISALQRIIYLYKRFP